MKFFDQLRTLDPRDVGRWPLAVPLSSLRSFFAVFAAFGWYMFVWNDDRPILQKAEADELDLRNNSKATQRAAISMPTRTQLQEMERSFGAMLRQLPGKTEVRIFWSTFRRPVSPRGYRKSSSSPAARRATAFTPSCDQNQACGHVSRLR